MPKTLLKTGASLLSITAFLSAAPATAQDRIFDEIIVTAQKKAESSQDVPISISAYSGDSLEDLGVEGTADLGRLVPGLEISSSSGTGSQLIVTLRGVGLNDFNTNNSGPVGIYSDEVYISSPILTAFQFFDTERVEVLKGPQGTLYGRNTTGGAIKFVSNKPSEEFEFSARGSYSSFNTTSLEAAVSGPISDNIRGRLAVAKDDSDGFLRNISGDRDENGRDTLYWRGMVDFDVSDNFFLRANIHGAQDNSPAFKTTHQGIGPGGSDALGYVGPTDPREGNYNRTEKINIDAIGGYLEANVEFGDITLTSVTAYDEADSLYPEDTDSSNLQIVEIDYGVVSETITQELRLQSDGETFDWLLGGYYLDETLTQNQTVDLFRELRPLTGGLFDDGTNTGGAPVLFSRAINDQDTQTLAVFGQVDYDVSDRLTLSLGGRYTDEQRDFVATANLEEPDTFGVPSVPVYSFDGLEIGKNAFSWRVGADYKATDDILVYANVSRGFKSGGFNGGFLSLDPAEAEVLTEPYDPEFLTAYEAGIKSDLLDNKLRLNASVFLNDFKGLQALTLLNRGPGNTPLQVLDNASDAQVFGVEFDAVFYPVENFLLNLTASFLDSELKDFQSASGMDFSGNRLANTPARSVTGVARYDYDLGSMGGAYAQASFAYKSDIFFTPDNSPLNAQDDYSLVNARIGYQAESENWGAAVFVNNLGDTEYLYNSTNLSDFGIITQYFGAPRSYGVELTVDF